MSLKVRIFFFTFGHNSWWKKPKVLFSKLYTVTKSWISPQQKLGSLAHKIVLDHQKKFCEDPCTNICTRVGNARAHFYRKCAHFIARVRILSHVRTFTTIVHVIVHGFLWKFHKDLSFCWGDIQLFVTMYNSENKT